MKLNPTLYGARRIQVQGSSPLLLFLLPLARSHYPRRPQWGSLVPDCMLHFTIVLKEFERQVFLSLCPLTTLFWTPIVRR